MSKYQRYLAYVPPCQLPAPDFLTNIGDDLWAFRRVGVSIRNNIPGTLELFAEWKARYLMWRDATLVCVGMRSAAHREWISLLDQLPDDAGIPVFYNEEHELLAKCLSEELTRLAKTALDLKQDLK